MNLHHRELHQRDIQGLQNPNFNPNFQKKRDKKAMDRESDPNMQYGEDSPKLNVRYILYLLCSEILIILFRSYVSFTRQGHARKELAVPTHTT